MDDKRESKEVLEIKTSKKNLKETPKVNSKDELEVIIAYSQIVVYGSMSSFWTLFLRIFLFFNSLSFFFHTACFSISSGVL